MVYMYINRYRHSCRFLNLRFAVFMFRIFNYKNTFIRFDRVVPAERAIVGFIKKYRKMKNVNNGVVNNEILLKEIL